MIDIPEWICLIVLFIVITVIICVIIDSFNISDDEIKYVYLPKDKKCLYCFKKHKIIQHNDCDYYEHNIECDKNHDIWNRTHRDSSYAGYRIAGEGTILNECKYCVEKARALEKYSLSPDARKDIKDNIDTIIKSKIQKLR